MNFEPNQSLDTVYRRVEALRGLTAREQVNVSVHGIDIVNPETNERMQVGDPFDYPDDAAGMDETQTKALQLYSSEPVPLRGLVAAGMARATAVNVANESAYERIADDSFEILLVHEFAHTLQEQHGLNEHLRTGTTMTTDADLAGMMLTEGDATLTAYQYWQEYDAGGEDPLALRNTTAERGNWTHGFYDKTRYYGARYLQAVSEDRRNAHVSQPPDTTAEVMHPNTTWDLPGPAVTAPAPAGWTVQSENRVGELTIRYTLRTNGIPYSRAAAASTGWWNDSMRTFDRPDGIATSWSTRWATEQEAREFASAWRAVLENRDATRDDGVFRVPGTEHTPELSYVIIRDGSVVHVAAASTTADARSIAAASGASNRSQTDAPAASETASRTAPVDDRWTERAAADSTWNSTADGRTGDDEGAPLHQRAHGTNVASVDTDGDGISDFVERSQVVGHHPWVVLPELHSTEKDVVVDVVYATSVAADQRLREHELTAMRSTWAGFPVDNPGSTSGVHLHVRTHDTTALDGEFGTDFDEDDVDAFYERRYGQPPGDGVVNLVVVSAFDVGSSELVAFGSRGGNVAVVRASESRPIVVTHELMHLVLGPIHGERDCDIADNSSHTCRGYLAPGGQAEPFLTELLTQALNRPWSSTNASHTDNSSVVGRRLTAAA